MYTITISNVSTRSEKIDFVANFITVTLSTNMNWVAQKFENMSL